MRFNNFKMLFFFFKSKNCSGFFEEKISTQQTQQKFCPPLTKVVVAPLCCSAPALATI